MRSFPNTRLKPDDANALSETGAIKFSYEQVAVAPIEFAGFQELNACRRKLLQLRLVGVGRDGIGFGNLSVREPGSKRFHITGSGSGGLAYLAPRDCAKVIRYDFAQNWLRSEGAAVASSESLTHAAVYQADASASAIIHCHSRRLWERLREVVPVTWPEVNYGTPEMAREVMRLFAETDVKETKIFVMGGHAEGVVAIGGNLDEAFAVLMSHGARLGNFLPG